MITTAVTGFIVAVLALVGITPTAWLIGAIWLAVKAVIVVGAFALAARGLKKAPEPIAGGTQDP